MNIVIIGAGKVGYNIAKTLHQKHNVTIIDKNPKAFETITETLDIMPIVGDIRDPKTYSQLEEEIDFLIAVTDNDEINLISSIILKDKCEIKSTIVRLANISYISANFHEKLDIDRLIFPFKLSATAVAKLTDYPKANNVKTFPFVDFILLSVNVNNPTVTKVSEINNEKAHIIGVEREETFIFLNEEDEIKNGDLLYFMSDKEYAKELLNKFDTVSPEELKNVLIYGANMLGIEIAKILSYFDMNIKILEADEKLAMKATEELGEDVLIINSSYEDEEMLLNEGLQYSDVAIAASLKDESNIIKSLQARKLGIKKIITVNNYLSYYSLMHSLKLSTIRGPKIAAYYEILEEIDSRLLVYERFFLGAKGKIFIKQIFNEQTVSPPKEESKVLIIRDDKIIELKEKTTLLPNDIVMHFNFSGNKKWIEAL
jgi:trk system potassium uptake protein TrkA